MLDSFKVETQERDSVWVLRTHGYINNVGGEKIARTFDEIFTTGGRRFLFNLEGSKIINSIGVSYLIEILEKILDCNGELAFCNCAPIIEKTFKIMGITQYAKIYASAETAIGAMGNTT